jgi:LAO/AO transport system kinase
VSAPVRPSARRSGRGAAEVDIDALVARAVSGEPRAVARLITLVENRAALLPRLTAALLPHTGHAQVLGVTGAPGVGKSTSTAALVASMRADDRKVGVLAVDPSSPFSGGALLGDRVRMQDHATDGGVFIRSMATRGHLGGLSAAAPQAVRVLDAAGFDNVLIETVGVGQAELEVAALADTVILLLAPGMGDGIQAAKAGILEVADVFVVNKADRDGADQVVRDLRGMQGLGGRHSEPGAWRAPIVKTVASRGEGVDDVRVAVAKHRQWMTAGGELERRRRHRAEVEIEAIALAEVRRRLAERLGADAVGEAAAAVVAGRTDPYRAAHKLLDALDR